MSMLRIALSRLSVEAADVAEGQGAQGGSSSNAEEDPEMAISPYRQRIIQRYTQEHMAVVRAAQHAAGPS